MSKHTADPVITAALRHLDPAPRTDLTEAERERADATFARIVATPSDEPVPVEPDRPRRRRSRLLVTVGLAGAAGRRHPRTAARRRHRLRVVDADARTTDGPQAAAGPPPPAAPPSTYQTGAERVAVAERRGGWTYVLLAGPETEAVCLMPDDLVGQDIPPTGRTSSGATTRTQPRPRPSPPTASTRPRASRAAPTRDGSSGPRAMWAATSPASPCTRPRVSTSRPRSPAIRFAAWWPAIEQSSDHPAETWSYTVHLADGSTRRTS